MGTGTLQTVPAPGRAEPPRAAAGAASLRPGPPSGRTMPGRLRIALAGLVVLALLAATLGTVAAARARAGTRQLATTSEPMLAAAGALYSALADADANSTRAYLLVGAESRASLSQFAEFTDRAARELAVAGALAGAGGRPGRAVAELSSGLATYVGDIQSARANNRQGYPVGAAYLLQASDLLEQTLLPDAALLVASARARVAASDGAARQTALWWSAGGVGVLLLVALVATQRMLTRRTNRLVNVGLAAATIGTLALLAGTALTVRAGHDRLATARDQGLAPVDSLSALRADVLQQRSYESRQVIDTINRETYEASYAARRVDALAQLQTALDRVGGAQRADLEAAATQLRDYYASHGVLTAALTRGDTTAATTYVTGGSGAGQSQLGAFGYTVDAVVADDRSVFTRDVAHGDTGLGALLALLPLGLLVVAALTVRGIDVRLREYR